MDTKNYAVRQTITTHNNKIQVTKRQNKTFTEEGKLLFGTSVCTQCRAVWETPETPNLGEKTAWRMCKVSTLPGITIALFL